MTHRRKFTFEPRHGPQAVAAALILVACSDPAVSSGDDGLVERDAAPWMILQQASDDGTVERIIAHELGTEPSDDVVLYGPEPSGALLLCPNSTSSVLRGSPAQGYVMDTFRDEGESFRFEPTSLGPHRLSHCPTWSHASGLGVAFTPEASVQWGAVRTLVLDPGGERLRAVPLERPDERANANQRIDDHRYAVSSLDADGAALRIVDLDRPDSPTTIATHEGSEARGYAFEPLSRWLVYATPAGPRSLTAYDMQQGSEQSLATLGNSFTRLEMVGFDDALVVRESTPRTPNDDLLIVREVADALEVVRFDLADLPTAPSAASVSRTSDEVIYQFEGAQRRGYAMFDPRTDGSPRVVAELEPDVWMVGPIFLEPEGLAAATLMRDETPVQLVWFALDGSTPKMRPFDLDISVCDPGSIPAVGSSQEQTFWMFCEIGGVPQTARWSPASPDDSPRWEPNVFEVETSDGPLTLRSEFPIEDKLLGWDTDDDRTLHLVDTPSGQTRTLSWDGWTMQQWFFPSG